ncbi:hypothetical protein Syun_007972 [Stephania yunnanensis]|uniref:MORF/ORRM1/DAG-like MORF domain-containing protein n=1 Tax=Stephania yunnanensis TaxID=152371 RepID=A0AAP0KZJ5_9MAGN
MALVTRRTLASFLSRTLTERTTSSIPSPIRYRFAFAALENHQFALESMKTLIRSKTSGSGYSPLNDPSPNWSNRPPKETILLDGCDYEHWLIVMEFPSDPKPSEDEMVSAYVKTLAGVVGSEEEAKRKIYSVCTTTYTGFGALISEELSNKVKGLPACFGSYPIRILMFRTKITEGICLSMEKSSIGHSFGLIRGSKRGVGLGLGTIDAGKQCRLKGESQFREKVGCNMNPCLKRPVVKDVDMICGNYVVASPFSACRLLDLMVLLKINTGTVDIVT